MKLRIGILYFLVFSTGRLVMAQEPDSATLSRLYPTDMGNLRFRNIGFAFPGMTSTSVMTDTVYVFNMLDRPMKIWFENLPVFIRCNAIPEILPSRTGGKILVTYDAVARNAFGRLVDYFFIMTDDDDQPKKRIIVSPTIVEDFSMLSDEEKANPPVVKLNETEFNFGTLKEGDTVTHSFRITNEGRRLMIIRGTLPSCGCTKASAKKTELAPGESTAIDVTFNSRRKKGDQYYTVDVITNDPAHSQVKLVITGMVEEQNQP